MAKTFIVFLRSKGKPIDNYIVSYFPDFAKIFYKFEHKKTPAKTGVLY